MYEPLTDEHSEEEEGSAVADEKTSDELVVMEVRQFFPLEMVRTESVGGTGNVLSEFAPQPVTEPSARMATKA